MKKIGLLSDTHGFVDEKIMDFFKEVDEIWHAGDIGHLSVTDKLKKLKPLRAVFGNIDGSEIRCEFPKHQRFKCEKMTVWMTHIGGYPGNYDREIKQTLIENPPDIFICGHSHILKVIFDEKLNCLHMNPGAAGVYGFHTLQTAIRFVIENDQIKNLEIFEKRKSNI